MTCAACDRCPVCGAPEGVHLPGPHGVPAWAPNLVARQAQLLEADRDAEAVAA